MTWADALSNPLLWTAVGGWALREWWNHRKERDKKIDQKFSEHEAKLADAVKDFNSKSAELTTAIVKLTVQVEHWTKLGDQMPKIVQDLNHLHAKVRELSR